MRADRLLSMMLMLQAKGRMTAQTLSERLEVSERTIYRDIEALSYAGIPIYTQSGTNGGIFLDEQYRVSLTGLTRSEIQSLFVAGAAGPLRDLGMDKAVEETLMKIFAALPAIQRDEVSRIQQRIFIDHTNWFQLVERLPHLPLLQQAVWEDRIVEFEYQSPDGTQVRRCVDALALVAKANIWYLVARKDNGELRTYRMVRIRNVTVMDTCFERREDFDLEAYWTESTRVFEQEMDNVSRNYVVLAKVNQFGLAYLEDFHAGRYEILSSDDEWYSLRLIFNNMGHAHNRVLDLGSNIRVDEPQELIDWIVSTARQVVTMYTGDVSPS